MARRLLAGLVVGIGVAWFVFRETDWVAVGEALGRVHWGAIAISHALLWASHFARVQRWVYIVAPVRPTPFSALLAAAQIGTLFNLLLPLRLGDAVRTIVLARLGSFRISKALALVALDRLAELLGLLTTFAVMLVGFPMDRDLTLPPGVIGNGEPIVFSSGLVRSGVLSSAFALVGAVAGLAIAYLGRERWGAREEGRGLVARLRRTLFDFGEGLASLRSGGALFGSYAFTVFAWLLNVLSLALMLSAFGIDYAWFSPLALLVLLAAFVVAPITPGLIGQFHLPLIAGLLLTTSGTTVAEAKGFALVAHAGTLIPIVGLGVYCLFRSGLGWADLWRRSLDARAAEGPGGSSGDES